MNTDRDLVRELVSGGRLPAALASNPLAVELAGEVLELASDPATVVLAFAPPARFAQGAGVLQGGVVAALLDFAMAFAAHAALVADERSFAGERSFSSASLNVHFLRPAPPARYIARGRVVRAGRSLLFTAAELARADEPAAAHGTEAAAHGTAAAAHRAPATAHGAVVATASALMPIVER